MMFVSPRRRLTVMLLLVVLQLGCMGNDIVAPEEIEDPSSIAMYFPGRGLSWDSRTAAEIGWDQSSLSDAIEFAVANNAETPADLRAFLDGLGEGAPGQEITGAVKDRGGATGMIVHRGYIVAEWGDTARTDMAFAVGEAFTATAIGLALDRGLILAATDPVGGYVQDDGYKSPHNTPITWLQTLQQTSEWVGDVWDRPDSADRTEGPDRTPVAAGTFWEANGVRTDRAILSATQVWGESLADVIDREIMTPVGASRSWRWQGYRNSVIDVGGNEIAAVAGTGRWGGGLWMSTRDLARFGILWARGGLWREDQILSPEFVVAATTPSALNPTHGYMWRLNTDGALWPAASSESFGAAGLGDNLLWIDPGNELVVVVRWIKSGSQNGLLERVLAALN